MADLGPTADELAALQPSDEDLREIRDLEALQQIALRCLHSSSNSSPGDAQAMDRAPRGVLTVLEYMGLYAALAFQRAHGREAASSFGPAVEEPLYELCRQVLARLDIQNIPATLAQGDSPASLRPLPPAAPPVAGDAERRLEELRAALHEKDREIERLTGLLDETRAALALLEEEQFNRRQAFLALEALQQGEEGPPPGAQAEEPPRAWWQARRRKTGSGE